MFEDAATRWATAYDSPLLKQFEDIARRSNISAEFIKTGDLLAALQNIAEVVRPELDAIAGNGALTATEAKLHGLGTVTSGSTVEMPAQLSEKTEGAEAKWNRWLENQPFIVKIFLHLLLFIMLPEIFTHRVEHVFLPKKERTTQLAIVTEIRNDFGEELAESLRCVRGNDLQVREYPNSNSRVIGKLAKHQSIEVLETNGAW